MARSGRCNLIMLLF